MIKSTKDGKWYPTKAKMLEAEAKVSEEAMVKKEEPKVEEQIETVEDNHKPFQKRMKDIVKILVMKEKGKTVDEIAGSWMGKSYVEEVIKKGYEQMETELKAQYHIVDIPEKIISTSEESEISKTKKEKKEKAQKEKSGATDIQREEVVLKFLKDNPSKAKDIFAVVNDKLNVANTKTTYYQLLGKMLETSKVTRSEETKLYSVA